MRIIRGLPDFHHVPAGVRAVILRFVISRPMPFSLMPTRRRFIQAGGTAAAALALFPGLTSCTASADYEAVADEIRRPLNPATADLRELVRLATLAPSGHNAQPWKFRLAPGLIEIYPDRTRQLPAVDPDDRELWIGLGSALENLVVAAEHLGYHPDVTYHLAGTPADHIAVALAPTTAAPDSPAAVFAAIRTRQCTRHEYDGQPVPTRGLNQLAAAATGAGIAPLLFTGPAMAPLLDYVKAGNAHQMTDDKFKTEMVHWVRFNDREALASRDGLLGRGSGNPSLPRWVAQLFIGSALNAKTQDKKDEANIRSSAGLLLFTSARNDPAAWLDTGRAYERFALRSTAMGLKNSFINQPCEVPELRAQVQSHLSLDGAFPQLLARFGHGPAMPRSLRRPVSEVLLTTAS